MWTRFIFRENKFVMCERLCNFAADKLKVYDKQHHDTPKNPLVLVQ